MKTFPHPFLNRTKPGCAAGRKEARYSLMKKIPTKRQIEQKVKDKVTKTINSLFKDVFITDTIPAEAITRNNQHRLNQLKKELTGIRREFTYLLIQILCDYKNYKNKPAPKKPKYSNAEESFRKFQALKKQYTVEQYLKKNSISLDELELYEEVESVLQYEEFTAVFVVKDGDRWEYLPFQATKRKYVYFIGGEKIFESNDLEKVERAMFKDYLKTQS